MENRKQQKFLQPINDSDRQGESNPRVFLKAKVIQASSQLNNPVRDKIFSFPAGQQPENPNFGQRKFAEQYRIGEQTDFTRDVCCIYYPVPLLLLALLGLSYPRVAMVSCVVFVW